MKVKNIRDFLAIIVGAIVFPGLWFAHGRGFIVLPGEILGATITIETLIAQFYWRKKSGESDNDKDIPAVP